MKITLLRTAVCAVLLWFGSAHAAADEDENGQSDDRQSSLTTERVSTPPASGDGADEAQVVVLDFDRRTGEIVVVSRRRAELLSAVPGSLTVAAGEVLRSSGYQSLYDISHAIPGFHYSSNIGATDNLVVRGLGTIGAGPHFEPGVAQILYGVPVLRPRHGQTTLLDMSQIEILKGPQGAALGKNVSLGAITYEPNPPTSDFAVGLVARQDFEDAPGNTTEAFVSGPIEFVDGLLARLSIQQVRRDGWFENDWEPGVVDSRFARLPQVDVGGGKDTAIKKNDVAGRLTLVYAPWDNHEIIVMAERFSGARNGKPREIAYCVNPMLAASHGQECIVDATRLGLSNVIPLDRNGRLADPRVGDVMWTDIGEPNKVTSDFAIFKHYGVYGFGWSELTFGYQDFLYTDVFDGDLSRLSVAPPRPGRPFDSGVSIYNGERSNQSSAELRIGGVHARGEWLVGFYADDSALDFEQVGHVAFTPAAATSRQTTADLESSSAALFSEFSFALHPSVTATVNARVVRQRKTGVSDRIAYPLYTRELHEKPVPSIADPRDFLAMYPRCNQPPRTVPPARNCNQNAGSTRDRAFMYGVSLEYEASDGVLLYVSHNTGWKAGGFNTLSPFSEVQEEDSNFTYEFEPEETSSVEVGVNASLASLDVQSTLFRTTIRDLQVSSFNPDAVGQTVSNAAEATSQGVETRVHWKLTPWLGWTVTVNYTDAQYDEFAFAPCPSSARHLCQGGFRDLSGHRLSRAPYWQGVTQIAMERVVFDNHLVRVAPRYQWVSGHHVDTELSPHGYQSGYSKLHMIVSWRPTAARWDWRVTLSARNIRDEKVLTLWNEQAALTGQAGAGSAFGVTMPGRQVALEVSVRI